MKAPSSRFAPFAFGLLASLVSLGIAGCASAPEDAPAADDDANAIDSEAEVRASCTNPRKYFASFRDGTRGACEPIAARRGQWLPEALFADAPADVQTSTCAYRWSGDKYSRPDRDAIAAKVGWTNGLAASCGTSTEPDVGLLQPIPQIDNWTQAGSVGCDVCGVLKNGKIWIVLPPEKIYRKQFEVQLSNGEKRAFQIQPTEARALSIQLPPPPRGTTYKSGRVGIL